MKWKSPIKPTELSLILALIALGKKNPKQRVQRRKIFVTNDAWWHVLVWRLSIRPFSEGREEEIIERRGRRERGSFFPFAVSPFHIFLSPFPQKPLTLRQGFWAPESSYLDAGQQTCCSCFCFCTVKLHVPICSHCSALQWMQKKQNKIKQNSCSLFKN